MKDKAVRGLGRGLSSLIPSAAVAAVVEPTGNVEGNKVRIDGEEIHYLSLSDIAPNPYQPRTQWNDENLKDLAESIKASGLLQPLIVRRKPTDANQPFPFELIAGERRLRALKLAGLQKAPVMIKDVDAKTSLEIALVENIQREDLNPIDEALGYKRLIREFNYSQEEVSTRIGRERSTITNALRLLNLNQEIQDDLAKGKLTAGHARALLGLENDSDRLSLKNLIISKALSVREAERLVREAKGQSSPKKSADGKSPELRFMEEGLMSALGTKVAIKHRGRRGRIEIEYYTLDQLDGLIARMQRN